MLLEQVVRFYLFGGDSLSYQKMQSVGSMGHTGYLQKSEFPDVVYEFKPGIDSYFKLTDFKTNSQGLRDKEYIINKPDGIDEKNSRAFLHPAHGGFQCREQLVLHEYAFPR